MIGVVKEGSWRERAWIASWIFGIWISLDLIVILRRDFPLGKIAENDLNKTFFSYIYIVNEIIIWRKS